MPTSSVSGALSGPNVAIAYKMFASAEENWSHPFPIFSIPPEPLGNRLVLSF